jgi:hypothetical protein
MKSIEHRRSPRKQANLLASFSRIEAGYMTNAGYGRALNLSEAGALIELPDPMSPGQQCRFTLLLDYGHNVQLEGRVVRVIPEANGLYQVGVAFRNLTPEDQYLLARQLAG